MKITSDEPFIATFLRSLAIVTIIYGLLQVILLGGEAIVVSLIAILGVAPLVWWMGTVVALLHRIARASEARAGIRPAQPAAVDQIVPAPAPASGI